MAKKLHEMWKERILEVLHTLYGNGLKYDKVEALLDRIIEKQKANFPTMWMRNLYTTQNFPLPLDDLFETIEKEDLCISANNTLTYSLERKPTVIPRILINRKAERNMHKKRMLDAEGEIEIMKNNGTYFEGCPTEIIAKNENAFQLKVKVFMNSIYGVQGQKGSILYAPDTAGAVTAQGRELITEMTWTMERLLYGNMHFETLNELYAFIDEVKKEIHPDSPLLSYITYWPTKEDVRARLIKYFHKTNTFYNYHKIIGPTLFKLIEDMTPVERVFFYYKNNLFALYSRNIKVFRLIDKIINLNIPFLSSCGKPKDSEVEEYSGYLSLDYSTPDAWNSIKEKYKTVDGEYDEKKLASVRNFLGYNFINPILEELYTVVAEFVMCYMSTPNRVMKYAKKRRRAIVVSDTDSVILNLHPHVANSYKLHCQINGEEYKGEHVAFHNEELDFKLVNIFTYICIKGTEVAGDVLQKLGHIPDKYRKWIEMKNEFLFKRFAMYSTSKKNYVVNTRLQEGRIVNKISPTGIKLNSSVIHTEVKKKIMSCIENYLIKSETIDPTKVMLELKNIESWIIDEIKRGNLTLGKRARYSGPKGYKTGVYQNDAGRSAYVWNLLYPNIKINTGDYGYIFNTTLFTVKDLEKMKWKFPKEAEMLKNLIFENPNEPKLAPYGLRSIMIPMSELVKTLPEWLVPYIDYTKLTNKHLQPLISLMPSLGMKLSALSSNKQTYSTLVNFS